ncbi:protein-L-isoaspartate(D-aspartate) O-methyltransferase [Kaarinaea lacus]
MNVPIAKYLISGLMILFTAYPTMLCAEDKYTKARHSLVKEIIADVQATSLYLDKEALDPRVMDAMAKVPRHEFVPFMQKSYAYQNRPLPIGHGQTISQPYIVAIMTDLIKPEPDHRILEIGTGSGYQAAILSEVVKEVYTIEIVSPLGKQAAERLKKLRYRNIHTRIGDGYYGWEEAAPFDGIVVTAAASHVPPPLIKQLKPGGLMIIPVGSPFLVQHLVIVEKHADGKVTSKQILPVRFVPLTGEH